MIAVAKSILIIVFSVGISPMNHQVNKPKITVPIPNPATPDMRFMPDDILKKKMLDTFVDINDVFLVVDDRQKVVDMWRNLGLNTWQVAPGDF